METRHEPACPLVGRAGKATARANARAKGYLPWAKPPLEQMPEQKVTSLGQSHRSSKCQSKRLPPLGKATARANARAKGYLPWAKPPLEQKPEPKVTSLRPTRPSSKGQS